MIYTEEELNECTIHEIRKICREKAAPPSDKIKKVLIELILAVQNGDVPFVASKRGRPPMESVQGKFFLFEDSQDKKKVFNRKSYFDFSVGKNEKVMTLKSNDIGFDYSDTVEEGIAIITNYDSANVYDSKNFKLLYEINSGLVKQHNIKDGDVVKCNVNYDQAKNIINVQDDEYVQFSKSKTSEKLELKLPIDIFKDINKSVPLAKGHLSCFCCENTRVKKSIVKNLIKNFQMDEDIAFVNVLLRSDLTNYEFISKEAENQCFSTSLDSDSAVNVKTFSIATYRAERLARSGKHVVFLFELDEICREGMSCNKESIIEFINHTFSLAGSYGNNSSITIICIAGKDMPYVKDYNNLFNHFTMLNIDNGTEIVLDNNISYSSIKEDF